MRLRRFIRLVMQAAVVLVCLSGPMPQDAWADGTRAADAAASVVSVLPQWPPDKVRTEEPEGSGIAVLDGRHILTARHVVDQAVAVRVRTGAGLVVAARLVGSDDASDVALLEIDEALPALEFGRDAVMGETVCAIGNSFGLGVSMSCGVVSAVHRAGVGFNPIEDFVQTDASVNPGASGGALVSRDGELVGMLSAIFTKASDADIGVNFALAAPLAKRVATALKEKGRVTWHAAGLKLVAAPLQDGIGRIAASVALVRPGSPAQGAGFAPGDIVVEADGRTVRQPADFVSVLARHEPPDRIEVAVSRGGQEKRLVLQLDGAK